MNFQQQVLVAALVQEGTKKIGGEKDPMKARSIVDSYVMDELRKNQPQSFIDSMSATDLQDALNANPSCPNLPVSVPTGVPGQVVVTSQNLVTSAELARQMEANNAALLEAMKKIIAEQNASQPPVSGGGN